MHDSSYWCCEIHRPSEIDLPEALEFCIKGLGGKARFMEEFRQTGGAIEFIVGWFAGRNFGGALGWKMIRRLADMQINLDFDIYS